MEVSTIIQRLRADPALTKPARIAIGLAMHEDGFAARDIARVASLRWGMVIDLRRALGELDPRFAAPRPRGAPAKLQSRQGYHAPRSLLVAVAALHVAAPADLPRIAQRLRLQRLTAYGIRRAIDYAVSLERRRDITPEYRCPECDQRSIHHPCDHCGHQWLNAA